MWGAGKVAAGRKAGETGAWGEDLAVAHLCAKGYHLVARNWRRPCDRRDELDLVFRDRELTVFVEVKTRRAGGLVRGMLALNGRKQLVLRRAIRAWLELQQGRVRHFRFDVVEIEYGPGRSVAREGILHVRNYPLFRTRLF